LRGGCFWILTSLTLRWRLVHCDGWLRLINHNWRRSRRAVIIIRGWIRIARVRVVVVGVTLRISPPSTFVTYVEGVRRLQQYDDEWS
jgi:hypothetical protein